MTFPFDFSLFRKNFSTVLFFFLVLHLLFIVACIVQYYLPLVKVNLSTAGIELSPNLKHFLRCVSSYFFCSSSRSTKAIIFAFAQHALSSHPSFACLFLMLLVLLDFVRIAFTTSSSLGSSVMIVRSCLLLFLVLDGVVVILSALLTGTTREVFCQSLVTVRVLYCCKCASCFIVTSSFIPIIMAFFRASFVHSLCMIQGVFEYLPGKRLGCRCLASCLRATGGLMLLSLLLLTALAALCLACLLLVAATCVWFSVIHCALAFKVNHVSRSSLGLVWLHAIVWLVYMISYVNSWKYRICSSLFITLLFANISPSRFCAHAGPSILVIITTESPL